MRSPFSLWVAGLLLLAAPAALWAQRPKGAGEPAFDRALVTVERDLEYGKAGERSLKLDAVLPAKKAEAPLPVVVWIHGGGWQGGDKASGLGRLAQLAATGKYAGFSVQYRLTDSAIWPAQIHDCKAAIRWIRAHATKYNLDPKRIGVWGSSAGGHLVSMLGTSGDVAELEGKVNELTESSRVSCVVDFCGPSDFLAFAKNSERSRSPGSPEQKLLGGTVESKPEAARSASPVTHVSGDDPPFLIVHGTRDPLVPLNQAELLHAALQKAGAQSTLVILEGGGHGIGGAAVQKRVETFLARHLLGASEDVKSETIPANGP